MKKSNKINWKKGLVLNTRGNNFFSRCITHGLGCWSSHSAWVRDVNEDSVYIQEAMGTKTKQVTSTWYKKTYYENLLKQNRVQVLDFNLELGCLEKLDRFQHMNEKIPYDYFAIYEQVRIWFGSKKNKLTTEKRLDCSELVARGLNEVLGLDVLKMLSLKKYEEVTPEHLTILYIKLQINI